MSLTRLNLLPCLVLSLALSATAWAQASPPPAPAPVLPAPPAVLPAPLFQAYVDRTVALLLTDGRQVIVRVLAVDGDVLVISALSNGQVRFLPVASVKSVEPYVDSSTGSAAPEAPTPPRRRYVALGASGVPSILIDVDVGRFHGFVNLDVLLPAMSTGSYIPLGVGIGTGIPLPGKGSAFKLDLFVHANFVMDIDGNYRGLGHGNRLGLGIGFGVHHTFQNGLTLGFTAPLIGYSVAMGKHPAEWTRDTFESFQLYYMTSGEAMPLFFIAHRF